MSKKEVIRFTKMQGCGNNYIYVWLPDNPIADLHQAAIDWSRPGFGIGSDGLITIGRSEMADFSMRIFNNDGSEAMMCGNGIRCCAKFVYDHKLTDRTEISFDTLAGIKTVTLALDDHGGVEGVKVDMGSPVLHNADQFVGEDHVGEHLSRVEGYVGTYVSMGNPHFVIFVDDVEQLDLNTIGPKLESAPVFPQRCNIEFAQIMPDGTIRMRVWERGSGITMACGTGACATSVAATLTQHTGRTNRVEMDGGTLLIEWDENNHILMTGPAVTVFEGEIV
ncbi:MAG: diaminopimelate epimerase [Bacteroidales bacterium]|nr:diaminopimelate epimerase [Candidatus Physcousia equi]